MRACDSNPYTPSPHDSLPYWVTNANSVEVVRVSPNGDVTISPRATKEEVCWALEHVTRMLLRGATATRQEHLPNCPGSEFGICSCPAGRPPETAGAPTDERPSDELVRELRGEPDVMAAFADYDKHGRSMDAEKVIRTVLTLARTLSAGCAEDSARLDWLEAQVFTDVGVNIHERTTPFRGVGVFCAAVERSGKNLRDAIDAAMAQPGDAK